MISKRRGDQVVSIEAEYDYEEERFDLLIEETKGVMRPEKERIKELLHYAFLQSLEMKEEYETDPLSKSVQEILEQDA